MTPHEKSLVKLMDERLFEPQQFETGEVVRIGGIRDDWKSLDNGTIIGIEYTRIGKETSVLVKRRGEMTVVWSILALNRELRTGHREPTPEDIIKDALGGLYLMDEKATATDIAERKRVIAEDRALAKAAKG